VQDVAILLEHVNFLDALDGLHVQLLEGSLELLVILARWLGFPHDLPSYGTLAACELGRMIVLWLCSKGTSRTNDIEETRMGMKANV
jgi:hypothetical protein